MRKLSLTALPLTHEPIETDQVVPGATRATCALHPLPDAPGTSVGVWEMSVGTMRDTEAEERFVVLTGAATVTLVDSGEVVEIGPGDYVELHEGERTRWDVTETLRKLYLA